MHVRNVRGMFFPSLLTLLLRQVFDPFNSHWLKSWRQKC